MAVTISTTNLQEQWSAAYGPLVVKCTGAASGEKYVLQIYTDDGTTRTQIADLRQPLNSEGDAVFQIQDIVQSLVKPDTEDDALELTGKFNTAPWANAISIDYGAESTTGAVSISGTSDTFPIAPGRLEWFVNGSDNIDTKMPDVDYTTGTVNALGETLTEYPLTEWGKIKGPKPAFGYSNTDKVHYRELLSTDVLTTSIINYYHPNSTGITPSIKMVTHCNVWQFDASAGYLITNGVQNTLANGGGPNVGEAYYPYDMLTFNVGPGKFTDGVTLSPNTKWIVLEWNIQQSATVTDDGFVRTFIKIVDADCLDYEPVQLSWQNKYGIRDYYTFRKKNERRVQIGRNTFDQSLIDYNQAQSQPDVIYYSNGGNTIYSQTNEEELLVTTDWLTDEEAQYLESLFRSGSVRIKKQFRPDGEYSWLPVTLVNSTYTERTYRKDRLFQYEINLKFANKMSASRGI